MGGAKQILIGVGSNIAPEVNVPAALVLLRDAFPGLRASTFYRTRPMKGRDQPPYLNGVLQAVTARDVRQVQYVLSEVERQLGRRRDPNDAYASRRIDLDLLVYGDDVIPQSDIPSNDLLERDFCLIPAAELAPDWVHPVAGRSLRELAAEFGENHPNIVEPVDIAFPA
jgi:2-amino-4-hydroxy-6-hydroxymethyldihydropteridine diphosphokinase